MKVALAQISPVFMDKKNTEAKIISSIKEAAKNGASLVVFGEALMPGYPFWVSLTNGAVFNSAIQKQLFARYLQEAVQIEKGELSAICNTAAKAQIAVYLGIVERPLDRGSHSLYCSLVYIDKQGVIQSVHRKLQPTYEERLIWAVGDGNGLKTHALEDFTLGGLNCWENWMPLTRTSLYAQGENLHVAVWPGSDYNTKDITRFIARESRSYVISVSSLLKRNEISEDVPYSSLIKENAPEVLANGGSCVAGPDGNWILPPILNDEGIFFADLQINKVFEERQNFDAVGHYSRPDVLSLKFNSTRNTILTKI
jgi:nitrilase